MRIRWLAGPASAAAIVMLAACGSSAGGTSSSAPAGGSGSSSGSVAAAGPSTATVKIGKSGAGKVLTNASGFTLYTFAADMGSTSTCYGTCAKYWPPLIGTPKLAAGFSVSGHFGTTTRKDGKVQVTFDGKPLYTYAGDTAPGETKGNALNVNGGVWNVILASAGGGASSAPSPAPSASSSGGGGGRY